MERHFLLVELNQTTSGKWCPEITINPENSMAGFMFGFWETPQITTVRWSLLMGGHNFPQISHESSLNWLVSVRDSTHLPNSFEFCFNCSFIVGSGKQIAFLTPITFAHSFLSWIYILEIHWVRCLHSQCTFRYINLILMSFFKG